MAGPGGGGRADRGVTTAVEVLYLAVFAVASVALLVALGRLHTAAVETADTAHSAARAASLAGDAAAAHAAAAAVVAAGPLATRCDPAPVVDVIIEPVAGSTWFGGAVTVTVQCALRASELLPGWLPGPRTVSASDTQPIDRFRA